MLGTSRVQHALQSRHWFPCSLAGQLFISVTTVLVQGQNPAAGLSILWPESLIIKFLGILSVLNGRNLASRVGSQCIVSGVSLHTSNILMRCWTLCRSPESCQRKCFLPLISVAIAGIQSRWVNDSSRLVKASLTLEKL